MNQKYDNVPVAAREKTRMERMLEDFTSIQAGMESNLQGISGIRRRALGDHHAEKKDADAGIPFDPSSAFDHLEAISAEMNRLNMKVQEQITEIERAI